ncbi:MAG: lyase family protein [Betaproteobacteria bacterium]
MSSVFESFLSTPEMTSAWGDREFVAAMLRFEAALARAQGQLGLIPADIAQSIVGACEVDRFDVTQIVRDSGRAGSLAIPLIQALKETVALLDARASTQVHLGSTSQDVIDTAMALASKPALALMDADLATLVKALIDKAERHAADPVLARTLMQPASVTSLGLKCIHWVAPLLRSRARLRRAAEEALCLQLGGAVGHLAQMRGQGAQVAALMARDLGLRDPGGSWHTQRDRWIALACELGLLVGSLGKMAKDLSLMSQFEVAELAEPGEPGRGGSSAMPHKRNPVACMIALAAAARTPARVAALLGSMAQEHERGLGGWQAELGEWPGLLMSAHGALRAMAQMLPALQVDTARMRGNIESLRAVLPKEAAQEWFALDLAEQAAMQVRQQLQSWRMQGLA